MQIEILQTISHYLSAEDKIGITLKSVLNWFQMFTSNNVKMYHGILIDRIAQKKIITNVNRDNISVPFVVLSNRIHISNFLLIFSLKKKRIGCMFAGA
jgi:hypothetical protein